MKWIDRIVWAAFGVALIIAFAAIFSESQVAEGTGVVFSDAFWDQIQGPARILFPLAIYLAVRYGIKSFSKK